MSQAPPSEHDQLVWMTERLTAIEAEHAELRAQVRYTLDEIRFPCRECLPFIERLRVLVGPWPHEKDAER